MPEISDLVKYAINYLSKYSSSKTNLERILKIKLEEQILRKKKNLLYITQYLKL